MIRILGIGLSLALMGLGIYMALSPQAQQVVTRSDPSLHAVHKFYDGDTFSIMQGGAEVKIRMLAIDTPETHHPEIGAECYGIEAARHLETIIGSSKVRLEADPKADNRDYYDRLLRYVYLPDGTNVNQRMVSDGYALAYTGFANTQTPRMIELETAARESKAGLWGSCEVTSDGRGWTTQQITPPDDH